jgi:hypothetical protein
VNKSGTHPFELTSQNRLDTLVDLAPRFFREVVGWDYADVLVTDESDLADFADTTGDRDIEVAETLARMATHYRITGRQIPRGSWICSNSWLQTE